MAASSKEIPSTILIVGSGVFGLSTAYSLAQNPLFASSQITLLDRLPFPAPDAASIDSSRIVRADYADIAYSRLAFAAQQKWRNEWWGADGIYNEPGLAVVCSVPNHGANQDAAAADGSDNGQLGRDYMRKSMANVTKLGLKPGKKSEGGEVEALETREDINRVFDDGTRTARGAQARQDAPGAARGDFGYINWRSGWANAEKAMRALRKKAEATGRIHFIHATVSRLEFSPSAVTGVVVALDNDNTQTTTLTADLVVLATGAWTPALIDTRGVCSATGQVVAYLPITDAEQSYLHSNPTLLNESSGMFIIPPRDNLLKIARHGYGYANPTTIRHPEENPSTTKTTITVSLPRTHISHPALQIPPEGMRACTRFLHSLLPSFAGRRFTTTRICWYTDTVSGDWILSYHPRYRNLFVATGGSGHAFKFLPVVGDRIVDCLLGRTPDDFKAKWMWPEPTRTDDDDDDDDDGHVWTADWRGGVKGMLLDDELAKREAPML